MQVGNFQSFIPQQQYGGGFFGSPVQASPFGGAQAFGPYGAGGMQTMNLLFNLMSSMAQLSQGWGAFGGGGFGGGYGFPQQPGGGFGGGYGFPQQPVFDYASRDFPNLGSYNPGGVSTGYGGGGGGGTGVQLPRPSDPREFASYIQAQIAGGALEGRTGVAQSDAIPGSRFGGVQDSTMWQASLARNYAYQFAAQAVGANPLSADGLAAGANAFDQMKPEAKLFMQVASVFKGNLLDGPGFYDNPGLKNLLLQKGLGNFVNDPQVGKTDVQTIGAIAAAINSGQLSLNEVINSGTISDLNRYNQVINYVSQGGFANDLRNYDSVPF